MALITYRQIRNFKPRLYLNDFEFYLNNLNEIQVESNKAYTLVENLVSLAYPTYENKYDRRWEYFYIPSRKCRIFIAVPLWIMEYNKEFFGTVHSFGNFHIKKGDGKNKDIEKFYCDLISETIRFSSFIEKDETILKNIIPYDIRTGKIKGRYIFENLLSRCRTKSILDKYNVHLLNIKKNIQNTDISLNEYLEVAAICYKASYKKEAENLSNLDMYKKWSDGRDGGMLSIKDWNSKKEFYDWYNSGQHIGSHPFEVVFSWHQHGIHLYPPDSLSPYFNLRVTNYIYAWDFLKMVKALIRSHVPFKVDNLDNVVEFLSGNTFFAVNKREEEHHIIYIPSIEYEQKYLPHIEWDDIKVVNWK